MVAFFEAISLPALAVAAGVAHNRFIGRFLAEGDPRRHLIAQALLYAGARSPCRCGCGTVER
jgi:hypothetical protein